MNRNALKSLVAVALLTACAQVAVSLPLVVNGGFETAPYPSSPGWDEGWGSPVGWTYNGLGHGGGVYGGTSAPNLTPNVKVFPIPEGTHAAYLWTAWGATAIMSQTVSGFEVGRQYVVSYLENINPNMRMDGDLFSVTLDATTVVAGHLPVNNPAGWWTVTSDPFTATATSHVLRFNNWTPASGDRSAWVFDAVTISEFVVPEPAGLAILGAGACLLLRRRRTT